MELGPHRRFACTADRVFDGGRTLPDHAVVIEDGVVSAVAPVSSLPADVPVLHEPGCTILPGLIDTHIHFMRWQGPLFLAHGVTTVRDMGNELRWILDRRREWSEHAWPRILCVGPILDGPEPYHPVVSRACRDASEAVEAVRQTAAAGVDGIKLYAGLDGDWLPSMVRPGHAAGLKVSVHCQSSGALAAARAGVDEFFHLDGVLTDVWPEHPPGWLDLWGASAFSRTWDRQRQVADSIANTGLTTTPTLAYWDSQWRVRTPDGAACQDLRGLPPSMAKWQAATPFGPREADRWRRALRAAQRFLALLLERQAPVLAGTDVPFGPVAPGASLWRELSLLVEAGMSPQQSLRAATSGAAAFLGRDDLGRLGAGATADVVFVRGNPIDRIPERPDIAMVVRNGSVWRPKDLLAAAEPAARELGEDPWASQFERHWGKG